MKKIAAIFWLVIVSACALSSSQQPTTISNATIIPTEIYLIPDAEPPDRILASLSISKLLGLEDEVIARLLLEDFLNQQMRDDTEINKITAYEIVEFRPQTQLQGRFYGCYIMTPASEIFAMNNARELEDGRIEVCNVFGVSKGAELYYLSGYYGG